MFYRIIGYVLFGMLVFAFVLSFAGIQEVYLGNGFTNWLRYVNSSLESWRLQIPTIPQIPYLEGGSIFSRLPNLHNRATTVVTVPNANSVAGGLKNTLNVLIAFFNFLTKILNVLIVIVNVLISLIQFVLTMVWCIKDIPSYLSGSEWARWNGETTIWWWPSVSH